MSSKNQLKAALLGFGTGGSLFHAPFIDSARDFEFAAIVTGNSDRQNQARQKYPDTPIYESLDSLLKDGPQLDLLVITTPNNTHHKLALKALGAGLNVIVDKPFALSTVQAQEMLELAATSKKIICPYQNRRYDSDYLTLQKIIEAGLVGKIMRLESRIERYRRHPKVGGWRETTATDDGGGVLYDLGSHLIDQIVHLFGTSARVTYARLEQLRGLGTTDDATLILDYGDFSVHLHASMICANPGPRYRLMGLEGAYLKEQGDIQEDQLRANIRPDDADFGKEPKAEAGILFKDDNKQTYPSLQGKWLQFYKDIALAIRGEAPPPVSGAEILGTIAIIEEALAWRQ